MKTTRTLRRHGLAMPIVLAVIMVLTIMAVGLILFGRSGLRQTGSVVADVEHLYRAEAIFHRILGRLKRSGWERRYYASPGERTRCCSTAEQGSYRDASYDLWVQDLPDEDGSPVPGIVDLLIRVVHRDTARNFVTRVRIATAANGGRRVETSHFARVSEAVESAAGRRRIVEEMNRAEGQREANRAESDTMARVLRETSRPGETTLTVLNHLRGEAGLSARIQRREAALETMRQALRALGRAGVPLVDLVGRANGFTLRGMDVPPDPARARVLLEALMTRLEAKTDAEGKELFRLAAYLDMRCRRLEIETMSILSPDRRKRVEELLALAERLTDAERRRRRGGSEGNGEGGSGGAEEWALGPYVLLELARAKAQGVLHGLGRGEDVKAILAEIAKTWPDHRLFGDDLALDRIWEGDGGGLEKMVVARATFPREVVRAIPGLGKILQESDAPLADGDSAETGPAVTDETISGNESITASETSPVENGSLDPNGNSGATGEAEQNIFDTAQAMTPDVIAVIQAAAGGFGSVVDAMNDVADPPKQMPNTIEGNGDTVTTSPPKEDPKEQSHQVIGTGGGKGGGGETPDVAPSATPSDVDDSGNAMY